MNSYKVSYSLFERNGKSHFSNCKSTIKGETFEDAVNKFQEQNIKEGWIADFIVEGDMFEVEFYDIKK